MLKKYIFSILGFAFASGFWTFDSMVHRFVYQEREFEWLPADFNEFWMRLTICLLIILFGIFADYHSAKIRTKELDLEKVKIFKATLRASHHIINNFLNQMLIFKLEAETSRDFDKNLLLSYNEVIKEASYHLANLSAVTEITEENISDAIKPISQSAQ